MIILKINEKGHYIEIPGMAPFRTPVEANITHISMHLVVSALKKNGIKKFEIISDTKGKETVLTQNDFRVEVKKPKQKKEDDYEERFNKLELLVNRLLLKNDSDKTKNQEQITNKLSSIEKLLQKQATSTKIVHVKEESKSTKKIKKKSPVVEEMLDDDTFIPEINVTGMKIKSAESRKTIKQNKQDIDDSADMLSRILQADD